MKHSHEGRNIAVESSRPKGYVSAYQQVAVWGGVSLRKLSSQMIQRVGDRDNSYWSIKPYAFTIASNPMSDRVQLVFETYEDRRDDMPQ